MSLCRSCLHRLSQSSKLNLAGRPIAQARFISYSHTLRTENDELSKAKARAWYLDPTPSTSAAPTPSSSSKRTPKFTTFDPESTRSDIETEQIHPLPSNATSPLLITLHDHLTRQSDSVESGSVRFLHAPSSQLLRPRGEGDEEGYSALLGESGGTNWEWVVTCQVKGRGRGVLNRAEKEIRKWMRESLGKRTRSRTASREESDTDWSMIHVGEGVCVNLFTAEGKERWNLEELWQTGR